MVFNATFNNNIVAVRFIGGGNRKSLTNLSHNVVLRTPRHERDSNSQC
jgi:hypothetical protein